MQCVSSVHRFDFEGGFKSSKHCPPLASWISTFAVPVIPSRHLRVKAHQAPGRPPDRASSFGGFVTLRRVRFSLPPPGTSEELPDRTRSIP